MNLGIFRDPRTSSKRTNSYVEKVIRFDDSCSSPAVSFSNEQTKSVRKEKRNIFMIDPTEYSNCKDFQFFLLISITALSLY